MPREKKIVFIINPIAGVKGRQRLEKIVDDFFREKNYKITKLYTEYAGHGSELARLALNEKPDIIVAAGGDGTINEVASSLINTDIPLGIIPLGSGNGFARHFNIPFNIKKTLEFLLNGSPKSIDVAYLNDKSFFCISGIGLDAKIAHYYKGFSRRGFIAYALSFVRVFIPYKSIDYKMEVDGEPLELKAFFLSIANISQFGYNFRVAPQADASDGVFDIVILKPFPKWKIIPIAIRSVFGALESSQYIWHKQARNLKIIHPLQDQFIHIDGDAEIQSGALNYSIKSAQLKVILSN